MDFHPYANVWPLLEGDKFDKFAADIKANGLIFPILTYQDQIIDGRNRYRACIAVGIEPRFEKSKAKNDKEALLLSISANEHRRHMDDDAIAVTAEKYWTLGSGSNQFERKRGEGLADARGSDQIAILSRNEAAEAWGASPAKMARVRTIKNHAPELLGDVVNGKKTLNKADIEARARGKAKKAEKKAKQAERKKTYQGGTYKRPEILKQATAQAAATPKLTREMVDPEWTGDDMAWVAEYGLVHSHTSLQRSTLRLMDWASGMSYLAKELGKQKLPKVTDRVIHWLRKPKPGDVAKLRAALAELEVAIATARRLLDKSEEST